VALNSVYCADVPLRTYSLTPASGESGWFVKSQDPCPSTGGATERGQGPSPEEGGQWAFGSGFIPPDHQLGEQERAVKLRQFDPGSTRPFGDIIVKATDSVSWHMK